jgi:hypothetical protein
VAAQGTGARLSLGEFSLELAATWERLTDTTYKFEQRYPLVRDLAPAADRARYDAAQFRPFLPRDAVAVGDTWSIDPAAALPFLRQFHPGATAELHHDSGLGVSAHGAWACLRLLTEEHAEVCLRVHADFMIEGDGGRATSSWFTPAQFRGRMVIDRKRGAVVAFTLGVPSQGVNVDVNIADGKGVFADIGRVPRMELSGGTFPAFPGSAVQIAEREAQDRLARRFYPFAEIPWLDLAAARAESLATGRPLHVIALFGSLMDESC